MRLDTGECNYSLASKSLTHPPTPLAQIGAEPMRAWVSGQVIAFDDSFEHEVMQQDLLVSLVRFSILNVRYICIGYMVAPHPTSHRLFPPQVRHYCGRYRSDNPLRAARQRVVFQVRRAVR